MVRHDTTVVSYSAANFVDAKGSWPNFAGLAKQVSSSLVVRHGGNTEPWARIVVPGHHANAAVAVVVVVVVVVVAGVAVVAAVDYYYEYYYGYSTEAADAAQEDAHAAEYSYSASAA